MTNYEMIEWCEGALAQTRRRFRPKRKDIETLTAIIEHLKRESEPPPSLRPIKDR